MGKGKKKNPKGNNPESGPQQGPSQSTADSQTARPATTQGQAVPVGPTASQSSEATGRQEPREYHQRDDRPRTTQGQGQPQTTGRQQWREHHQRDDRSRTIQGQGQPQSTGRQERREYHQRDDRPKTTQGQGQSQFTSRQEWGGHDQRSKENKRQHWKKDGSGSEASMSSSVQGNRETWRQPKPGSEYYQKRDDKYQKKDQPTEQFGKLSATSSQTSIASSGQERRQQHPDKQAGGGQGGSKQLPKKPQQSTVKPSVSNVASSMQQVSLSPLTFVTRPPLKNNCTNGKIKLQSKQVATNYLTLNFDLSKFPDTVLHYDITLTPDRPKKMLRPAFRNFIQQNFPNHRRHVGFDGRVNVYCNGSHPLPEDRENEEFAVVVHPGDGGSERSFTIKYQLVATIDMKGIKHFNQQLQVPTQQAIQALDVIIRTVFDRDDLIRFKQSVVYFPPRGERDRIILVDGYEMYIGLFQSCIFANRVLLNIDCLHKAFPSGGPLINLKVAVRNRLGNERYRNREVPLEALRDEMHGLLNGVQLVYTSPVDRRRILRPYTEIMKPSDQEWFVDDKDNKRKTVAAYFAEQGALLRNPREWCVQIGNTRIVDGNEKRVLIPMEFLEIPAGQALNSNAPESCKTPMIRGSATSTNKRKQKILDKVAQIDYNNAETLKEFGITVGEDFINIDSHILPAPGVNYARGEVMPNNGAWNADKEKFLKPASCTNWGVLNTMFPPKYGEIQDFAENFARIAIQKGLNFAPFQRSNVLDYTARRFNKQELLKKMNEFKANSVQFIFVLMSNDGGIYPDIKKVAELECGILTQCLKMKTMTKKTYHGDFDLSTVSNILLKVNTKLNGINHVIGSNYQVTAINKKRFMLIGADVTHPSPGQTTIPSVVGVAASYDKDGYRYKCQWRLQNPTMEVIENFEELTKNQLAYYYNKNGNYPEHILYYRDGVDDGRIKELNDMEIQGIKKAVANITPCPLITVIVVQKRHHTRFFPNRPERSDYSNPRKPKTDWNNVPPGFVVDHGITDPTKWQFFMVSHVSLQGTAKPTKYWVAYDDSGVTNEDLQIFTYNLCHLFARCNRTVSYVAPTYYAHHVAARGRVYIQRERIDFSNLANECNRRRIKDEIINDCPMFFI